MPHSTMAAQDGELESNRFMVFHFVSSLFVFTTLAYEAAEIRRLGLELAPGLARSYLIEVGRPSNSRTPLGGTPSTIPGAVQVRVPSPCSGVVPCFSTADFKPDLMP